MIDLNKKAVIKKRVIRTTGIIMANMRSIHKDYLEIGNALWERFNADLRQQAWYYGEMTEVLADMQDYPETNSYYFEFVELYKDVFVAYFYDKKKKKLYQCNAMGEAYCLKKGSPEWLIMADVIPEEAVVVSRKFAETTEDAWNQAFWKMIDADIQDRKVELFSNTEFSFRITIEDKKLCFEGAEYGKDCDDFFGSDEIEFHYKLDKDSTYRMISLLRIQHGKKATIEDILKLEFAVENGVNAFINFCKKYNIYFENVII